MGDEEEPPASEAAWESWEEEGTAAPLPRTVLGTNRNLEQREAEEGTCCRGSLCATVDEHLSCAGVCPVLRSDSLPNTF